MRQLPRMLMLITLVVGSGACGRSDLFSARRGGGGGIGVSPDGGFAGEGGSGRDGGIDTRDGGPDAGGRGGAGAVGGRGGSGGAPGGRGGAGGTAGRGGAGGSGGRGGMGGGVGGRGGMGGGVGGRGGGGGRGGAGARDGGPDGNQCMAREICNNNGRDDDCNNLADCNDPGVLRRSALRAPRPGGLQQQPRRRRGRPHRLRRSPRWPCRATCAKILGFEAAACTAGREAPRKLHALTVCDNAAAFAQLLPARGSLLALDVSKRRIGLAGTDQERRLATVLADIRAGRTGAGTWTDCARAVRDRQAVGLVVGLPLNMDDSEGPMARAARAEAKALDVGLGAAGAAAGRAAVDLHGRGRDRRRPPPATAQRPSRSTTMPPQSSSRTRCGRCRPNRHPNHGLGFAVGLHQYSRP